MISHNTSTVNISQDGALYAFTIGIVNAHHHVKKKDKNLLPVSNSLVYPWICSFSSLHIPTFCGIN